LIFASLSRKTTIHGSRRTFQAGNGHVKKQGQRHKDKGVMLEAVSGGKGKIGAL
jgi:hypothetical protein